MRREDRGSYNRKHRASKTVPLRQAGRGAKRRRGWMIQTEIGKLSTPSPLRGTRPCLRGRVSYYRLVPTSAGHYTPAPEGRKGPLEKVLNILSCPLRGALPSATRRQISIATRGRGSYNRKHRASKTVPLRQAGRGATRRRGWMIQTDLRSLMSVDDCFSLMNQR